MNADPYAWYRRALAATQAGQRIPAIVEDQPQCGMYRRRKGKGGPWIPAAIWQENGELRCRIGNDAADPHVEWLWLAKNPVPQEDAMAAFQTGRWPDDMAPDPAPTIGHNNGPVDLPDQLKIEIDNAAYWLEKIQTITNQQDCTIAANMAGALVKIANEAKAKHAEEKEPHLTAGRAVDAKWLSLIESAKNLAAKLKGASGAWMVAEEKRLQKEQLRSASPEGIAEPIKFKAVGGARGQKVALKTYRVAVITDYTALFMALKDNAAIKELVEKLANRSAQAGVTLPGMEISEERRAV